MRKLGMGKNKVFNKCVVTVFTLFIIIATISTSVKAEVRNNNIVIPKTGDDGLGLVIGVLILSGAALLVAVNKQKVESRE
ncbi:LPXTG cell wall anchor domain-containing protein [Clostridium sp. 1001271B_151109_B4]|uniref:LPXTG cell wall anchor domain-containing protein n=1 Tax=Clostridium sp. 1001271B_151109_B4 TaxID=2787148 RepID=UPI0018A90C01|nr:LPXTG cell wall anchor domain-containing protein [Clostridium sp. 1001271B_151109_B4]